ncbi:hypothetical protein FA15DRAFT_661960 [Coprinopsis marcescibilis]|uniref:Uncharacterized protein n=1 Tax=Coprinopsis marcescibilis TaxID=230819 RepID=A0A5C3K9G9_COPMA|nr:hypothetical protein FA15DRAFT_661960 [Coprinopsis marcescibilis]
MLGFLLGKKSEGKEGKVKPSGDTASGLSTIQLESIGDIRDRGNKLDKDDISNEGNNSKNGNVGDDDVSDSNNESETDGKGNTDDKDNEVNEYYGKSDDESAGGLVDSESEMELEGWDSECSDDFKMENVKLDASDSKMDQD